MIRRAGVRVGGLVLSAGIRLTQSLPMRRFLAAANDPQAVQTDLLRRILARNSDTVFGRRYGFTDILGPADFGRAVPLQTYEDLRPLIERQELTGERCLTVERPVFYQRTSGTLGTPKNIPITATGIGRIGALQRLSALSQLRGSNVFQGKTFAVVSAATEGRMPGGAPFGSASGLLYRNQPALLRARYVVPAPVFEMEDYDSRYLAIAACALAEADVTGAATANPSTFVRLQQVINENMNDLLQTVATGRLPNSLPAEPGNDMACHRFRADPGRAKALAAAADRRGRLCFSDIWPRLAGIVTWTGGSCSIPLNALAGDLPPGARVMELGYLSSEFRGTVNVDVATGTCLPTLEDNFFEFVEREAHEAGEARFLGLHQLQVGQDYYIFVTTPDGLYRYDINDIVRVTGRVGQTPALAFVQKGKGVTNITGEKLHERQVVRAVERLIEDRQIASDFFIMIADEDEAVYRLYLVDRRDQPVAVNALAECLDRHLRKLNVEYDSKRASGRLALLKIRRLAADVSDAYRRTMVAAGQRDAQFKVLHLQYRRDCVFDFDAYALKQNDVDLVQPLAPQ